MVPDRKGSNKKSKRQPKGSPGLAHRTVSGAPGPSTPNLPPSGIRGGRSAIIHRTVRCSTGLSGVPSGATVIRANGRLQRNSKTLQCVTARAEARAGAEGAPDSEQNLSGAPPHCPVAPLSEAPTVGTQRPGDVAGAPDSVRCAIRQKPSPTVLLVVGAINTPQLPHFNVSKFSVIKPHTRALDFIPRHKQRDQILSQVRNHSKQISD
jgi:hypothetical protein